MDFASRIGTFCSYAHPVKALDIEDALRGRTTARPPLVKDFLLKINALGRCGPISLADFGTLTWLDVGCLESLCKQLGGKDGLS